jgi:hypothetical protein
VKLNHADGSLLLFGLSLALLLVLTLSEPALAGMPVQSERITTFFLLVLPAAVGAGLGVTSLTRREGRMWRAIAGIVLNTLFALFHFMIVLLAG